MAKKISSKKVISVSKKETSKRPLSPTASKGKTLIGASNEPMLFGTQNYILMGIGVAFMIIGFLLMLGGEMPDPDTWDEDIIYSFNRIVLAPGLILAGLVALVFAIFKKQNNSKSETTSTEEAVVTE